MKEQREKGMKEKRRQRGHKGQMKGKVEGRLEGGRGEGRIVKECLFLVSGSKSKLFSLTHVE